MLPALLKKTKYMHTVCTNDLWKDTQEIGCAGCLQGTRQGAGVGAKHFIVCLLNPVSCTGMAYLKIKMKRREKDNMPQKPSTKYQKTFWALWLYSW